MEAVGGIGRWLLGIQVCMAVHAQYRDPTTFGEPKVTGTDKPL